MNSHELAHALLARRANDVRIVVRNEDFVNGEEVAEEFLTEIALQVRYCPDRDVIILGEATTYGAGYDVE